MVGGVHQQIRDRCMFPGAFVIQGAIKSHHLNGVILSITRKKKPQKSATSSTIYMTYLTYLNNKESLIKYVILIC